MKTTQPDMLMFIKTLYKMFKGNYKVLGRQYDEYNTVGDMMRKIIKANKQAKQ